MSNGELKSKIDDLNKLSNSINEEPCLVLEKSMKNLESGNKDAALSCINSIVTQDINIELCKGLTYFKFGNSTKDKKIALECFDKVLKREPKNLYAKFGKGMTYYKLEDKDKAIDCFKDSEDITALLNKNLIYFKFGNESEKGDAKEYLTSNKNLIESKFDLDKQVEIKIVWRRLRGFWFDKLSAVSNWGHVGLKYKNTIFHFSWDEDNGMPDGQIYISGPTPELEKVYLPKDHNFKYQNFADKAEDIIEIKVPVNLHKLEQNILKWSKADPNYLIDFQTTHCYDFLAFITGINKDEIQDMIDKEIQKKNLASQCKHIISRPYHGGSVQLCCELTGRAKRHSSSGGANHSGHIYSECECPPGGRKHFSSCQRFIDHREQ